MSMLDSLTDDDDYLLHGVVVAVVDVVVVVAAVVVVVVVVGLLRLQLLERLQQLLVLGPFVEHVDVELPLPLLGQLQLVQMDDQMDQMDLMHWHDVDQGHQKQLQLLMLPVRKTDLD
jgi:hypothetical protein